MTRSKFWEIYDCIVRPIVTEIVNNCNAEASGAAGQSGPFLFCENFDGLYECYLLKKNTLKTVLKQDVNKAGEVLDRHKIAASLAVAVAQLRLISDMSVDEQDDGVRYSIHDAHRSNEQAAFWSGVATLMMYMTTKCEEYTYSEGALEKIKAALDAEKMIFPASMNGTAYEDSAIRGLFYGGNFYGENPILLANTFYWMEQYFYKHIGVTVTVDSR